MKQVESQLLKKHHRKLVENPLIATMAIHMLEQCRGEQFSIQQLYAHVSSHFLQSLDVAKYRDTSGFRSLQQEEVSQAVMKLAYDTQKDGGRNFDETAFIRAGLTHELWALAQKGQLALFNREGHKLQFFHLSIQEYLAAKHAWINSPTWSNYVIVATFPSWLTKNVPHAIGACRFLAVLAPLQPSKVLSNINNGHCRGPLTRIFVNTISSGDLNASRSLVSVISDRHSFRQACGSVVGMDFSSIQREGGQNGQGGFHTASDYVQQELDLLLTCLIKKKMSNYYMPVAALLLLSSDLEPLLFADSCWGPLLHIVARRGDSRMLQLFVDCLDGGTWKERVLLKEDSSGATALHHAACGGHTEAIHLLLTNVASRSKMLLHADSSSQTALHVAAYYGKTDVSNALIEWSGAEHCTSALMSMRDIWNEDASDTARVKGHMHFTTHLDTLRAAPSQPLPSR
jgi:hypothetical protein